ncbi:hypothetical protein JHK87_005819 [Glycine soja]|nr:hypothetical protein JHK87_005819 [Glycine soja]
MGSRKEEERNEKIIRGLMKLPPNRRCINCNSLGPQYVCANFWTFVCMTCSGIHREFTHRVKSVSMAMFTSQEVDALQNGGNQRAREIHLKNWDFQRQRLPDSSNVDKVREFIRNVYVDQRYAAAKSSDKPPRDVQAIYFYPIEDDTRRASSYHSYSQSPPYDYQYEDRRYGKQAAALTRKPGSDKVCYERKISSIIFSPGRFSDHAYDDRFANERSGPRISDFSMSNGDADGIHRPQDSEENKRSNILSCSQGMLGSNCKRTTSLGSTDSNLSSLRSYSSGGLVDFFSEPFQASGPHQNKVSCTPQPSDLGSTVSSDLSEAPVAPKPFSSSASSIDLFQLPAAPSQASSVDLFQSSALSAIASFNERQPLKTSQSSSVDFMDLSQQPSAATSSEKSLELSVPENEGWATFDMPQHTSTAQVEIQPAVQEKFDPFLNLNANTLWPCFETSSASALSSVTSNLWRDVTWTREEQVSVTASNSQIFMLTLNSHGVHLRILLTLLVSIWDPIKMVCTALTLDSSPNEINHKSTNPFDYPFDSDVIILVLHIFFMVIVTLIKLVPSDACYFCMFYSVTLIMIPPIIWVVDAIVFHMQSCHYSLNSYHAYSNLFFGFLLFVTCVQCQLQFLDVSSLQAALPDSQLSPTFQSGIAEPWLPQNTLNPYFSSAGQGGLTFMAAPPPSSQILYERNQFGYSACLEIDGKKALKAKILEASLLPSPHGESYFHHPAGRYCDGRLIVDFLAKKLGLPYLSAFLDSVGSNYSHGANFATAGSTIRPQNTTLHQTGGFSPFSLDVQFNQFSDFQRRTQFFHDKEDFSQALYTFDIGQNDLTSGYFHNMSSDQVKEYVPDVLAQFKNVIKYVYNHGGRSFWVHNTGPVGCLPYIMDLHPVKPSLVDKAGCANPYNEVAKFFNSKLKEVVVQLRKELPLAAITYVDVYSVKYSLISQPKKHGFEEPLRACCGHGGKYNYNLHIGCGAKIKAHGKEILVGKPCKDPSVWVNWDGVHYTEAANKWVFDQIVDGSFSDPPIPLSMACHKHL